MAARSLQRLFEPRSIAVIGASDQPAKVGTMTLGNLAQGGFGGPSLLVATKKIS